MADPVNGDPSAPHHEESTGVKPVSDKTPDISSNIKMLDVSSEEPPGIPPEPFKILDYSGKEPSGSPPPPPDITEKYNAEATRETTRGDLARGLLWLLTFTIGGVLIFIGLGRLDGTVLTQSVFPSLIALAGTALGFYFGSQTAKESAKDSGASPGAGTTGNPNTSAGPKVAGK